MIPLAGSWRRPGPLVVAGSLAAAPAVAVLAVVALGDLDALTLSLVAFVVLAAGLLAIPPRGLLAARSWVVGYLVLQFPVRTLFLLSEPEEPPPIYHAWAPGTGLEPLLTRAMVQANVALVVLGAAYLAASPRAGSRSRPVRPVRADAPPHRGRVAALLAVAVVLVLGELRGSGGEATGGGDFIIAMPGLAAAGASAAVCYAFARRPRAYVGLFAAALVYNAARVALLSSKLSLLAGALALLIGFSTRSAHPAVAHGAHGPGAGASRPDRGGMARVLRNGLAVAVIVLAAAYAFAAAVPSAERGSIGPSVVRGAGNAVSRSYGVDALLAVDAYLDAGGRTQDGASLTSLAWSWIPRPLWPDKPKSFSIEFGEEVFSFSSIAGESYFAPGYLGEWVLNWGAIGLVVGSIVFGVALARVDAMASLPRRVLWIIVLVHLVEGSIVAQFWLAAPFLVGGYWVLGRERPARTGESQEITDLKQDPYVHQRT